MLLAPHFLAINHECPGVTIASSHPTPPISMSTRDVLPTQRIFRGMSKARFGSVQKTVPRQTDGCFASQLNAISVQEFKWLGLKQAVYRTFAGSPAGKRRAMRRQENITRCRPYIRRYDTFAPQLYSLCSIENCRQGNKQIQPPCDCRINRRLVQSSGSSQLRISRVEHANKPVSKSQGTAAQRFLILLYEARCW